MAQVDTIQQEWRVLNQASDNNGIITNSVNTFALTYFATDVAAVDTGAASAQTQSNRAALDALYLADSGRLYGDTVTKRLNMNTNGVRIAVVGEQLTADPNDDTGRITIWGWDVNGGALDLCTFDVTIGDSEVTANWETGVAFSGTNDWNVADTITFVTNNVNAQIEGTTTEGMAQLYMDVRGRAYIMGDFDLDAGSGDDLTDCIVYYKGY